MRSTAPSGRPGMGAIPHAGGTSFRVWAPHAEAVFVTGTFDDWARDRVALRPDGDGTGGTWSADVAGVEPGAEYSFTIRTAGGDLLRMDPYARHVTSSVGNAIVYDPAAFDWGDDAFRMPTWNDLVIYEMHIGTFAASADRRGTFDAARRRLDYLERLGVSAVQVMPPFEFAGDISWGYNPAHLFAIESGYGGPDAFKRFVRDAHAHGIAVIVDVVYNHLGPSDLDLWRFDGWAEGEGGGIYVYNDRRAITPWGATRPDYGRGEVRTFLRDSAMTWLEEFRCDGLRFDATVHIRTVDGDLGNPAAALPDGWSFMAWINDEIRAGQPWKITIAEDLQDDPSLVKPTAEGGAGFARAVGCRVPLPHPAGARGFGRRRPGHRRRGRGDPGRGPGRGADPGDLHGIARRGRQRQDEGAGGDRARRRGQLVGQEAGHARLGARPDVAGDPDAVPGPGAARGPLVRRHRRPRLGEGQHEQGCPAPPSGPHRPAAGTRRGDAGVAGLATSRSSAPTATRRSWRCTAGWTAGPTTTRS